MIEEDCCAEGRFVRAGEVLHAIDHPDQANNLHHSGQVAVQVV